MRSLNMNDLPWLRYSTLKGKRCIGKGEFASVYGAKSGDYDTIIKVTADVMSYHVQADQLFQEVRAPAEQNFPRLIENFGDIGESCGATVYMVELERLRPVSTTAHRRLIRTWIDGYASVCRNTRELTLASLRFCEAQARLEGPVHGAGDALNYTKAWEAMVYFLSNYGGVLDLKVSNFMERPSTGQLVFNDVVFDALGYERRSRERQRARLH